MKNKAKYIILLTIFIIAFICSGILTFVSVEEACGGIQTTCYAIVTGKQYKMLQDLVKGGMSEMDMSKGFSQKQMQKMMKKFGKKKMMKFK